MNLKAFQGQAFGVFISKLPKATPIEPIFVTTSSSTRLLTKIKVADATFYISDDIKISSKTIASKASKKLLAESIMSVNKHNELRCWLNIAEGTATASTFLT